MANKKTKKRSNWSPPRTSGTGPTSTRQVGEDPGPEAPVRDRPAAASGRQQAQVSAGNRQARKEEARRQREALRKKAARRRTARLAGIAAAVVAIVVGIVLVLTLGHNKASTTSKGNAVDPATLSGILRTAPPWPANNDPAQLKSRLNAIGLHALGAEGSVEHIHMHLDIYADGQQVTVPPQIGIASDGSFLAELHTHDATGIIHFESPTETTFTLGQFFDDWGVYFTKNCIGNLCNSGDKQVRVYVDGKQLPGDPTKLAFKAHQEIVVTYGTTAELPNPIPKSYDFGTL